VGDLIQFGKVKRAYLGVQVTELTEQMAKTKQMNTMMGIFVAATIQNGAAWRAGIKSNDVLIQIDDKKINSRSELVECLGQYQPGEIAIVHVLRAGKVLNYTVKLDSDNQE
jgi:S1-C subfamily serine protease